MCVCVFFFFFGGGCVLGLRDFGVLGGCGVFVGVRVLRVFGVVGFRGTRTRDIALMALYGLLRLRYQLSDVVVVLKHKAQGVEDIL